MSYILTPETLP